MDVNGDMVDAWNTARTRDSCRRAHMRAQNSSHVAVSDTLFRRGFGAGGIVVSSMVRAGAGGRRNGGDPALVRGWRHLSSCPKKKRVERPVGSAGRRGGVRATGREWALTPKRVSDACVAFHPPCPEGIRRRPA